MTEPVTIGIGATKWVKDSNTKMMSLSFPSTGSAVLTCHDDTDTDYQVPVGKKFVILMINTSGHSLNTSANTTSSSASYYLWKGTTIDSATGINIWRNGACFTRRYSSGIGESSNAPSPANEVYFEISAGNYLTFNSSNSVGTGLNITGIETDV